MISLSEHCLLLTLSEKLFSMLTNTPLHARKEGRKRWIMARLLGKTQSFAIPIRLPFLFLLLILGVMGRERKVVQVCSVKIEGRGGERREEGQRERWCRWCGDLTWLGFNLADCRTDAKT